MKEKKIILSLFVFLFIVMVVLSMLSRGSGYGGGDSILHMLFSKFSFKHPELFLHHWGKPFFILAGSPFAQFGMHGIYIFNIVCSLSTAFLVYLLAKEFKFENSGMAIFFSLFAPIYFVSVFSGLTEIFFGFILVLSIILFVRGKYILSSFVISFLPFIRTEGYLLVPLFVFVLCYRKKFASLPFLLSGTFIYSFVGGIYYHDFLWTVHQNPYAAARTIYGNGELFHFVNQNEFILGTSLVILFLLGILSFFFRMKGKEIYFNRITVEESSLVYGSFAVYFIAHTVFWWKGIVGSDGLIRVMAAVTPLTALLSLRGANVLLSFRSSLVIKFLIIAVVIVMPFKQHTFPRPLNYEEITLHNADGWIRQNNLTSEKIIYAHPFIVYDLDRDPFDTNSVADWYVLKTEDPSVGILPGDVVIWDSHFCPNEGRIPLNRFSENRNFKLLNSFASDLSLTPKSQTRFEVHIFQRI